MEAQSWPCCMAFGRWWIKQLVVGGLNSWSLVDASQPVVYFGTSPCEIQFNLSTYRQSYHLPFPYTARKRAYPF